MHEERIVDDLDPNQRLGCEDDLPLEAIDERRVQLVDEDATKERIGVQHDDLVAEARDHDLVLLSLQSVRVLFGIACTILAICLRPTSSLRHLRGHHDIGSDRLLEVPVRHRRSHVEVRLSRSEILHSTLRERSPQRLAAAIRV